jgi:hypothetical protein
MPASVASCNQVKQLTDCTFIYHFENIIITIHLGEMMR